MSNPSLDSETLFSASIEDRQLNFILKIPYTNDLPVYNLLGPLIFHAPKIKQKTHQFLVSLHLFFINSY